jgi:magnesium transporter
MPDRALPAPAPRTAGELVASGVPTCAPGERVGTVRQELAGRRFESLEAVAVLDRERLAGLVRLVDLVAAQDDALVESLMDPDPPRVGSTTDREVAARQAVAHHGGTLAVVGEGERFLGLIPPHRMMRVLLAEHDEDLSRLAGVVGSRSIRRASVEAVHVRVWHRLPWLLLGLAGALLAAVVVGGFEEQLADNVLLAAFIPGVVYMADAVGTQTETLVIRGLAAGVGVRAVARPELITGLVVGIVVAGAFAAVGLAAWDDPEVIAVVALSLLAACSVATVVAMALPALLARLGQDPAFGSGPLATVIQDLLSILIYFLIAAAIVG